MSSAKSWIKRLLLLVTSAQRESGQSLAEYSLLFAMVVLGSVMAVTAIGIATNGNFLDLVSQFS
jgi:hypothetical protein